MLVGTLTERLSEPRGAEEPWMPFRFAHRKYFYDLFPGKIEVSVIIVLGFKLTFSNANLPFYF